MTTSSPISKNFVTDTWVETTWEEFLQLAYEPAYQNGRAYYYNGKTRIEMTPIGWNHSKDYSIISTLVMLFCAIKNIPAQQIINCSFRKAGVREAQPDIAFYLNSLDNLPTRSNSPVDLNQFSPPSLVIEIASSSLGDDLGEKRLLYEQMNIQEYWVVAVNRGEVTIFNIADGGSKAIQSSQVLPGLTVTFIQEVLKRSLSEDHSAVTRWILTQLN
jgi:Uma2 family endonuclease